MQLQRLIVRRSVAPETRIQVPPKRRGVSWEFSLSESKVASRRARRLEQEAGTKSKGGKERGGAAHNVRENYVPRALPRQAVSFPYPDRSAAVSAAVVGASSHPLPKSPRTLLVNLLARIPC